MEGLPSFLSLSDDELMLLLCVRPERLAQPKQWCREMRSYVASSEKDPKSPAETERLKAILERLMAESNG